MLVRHPTKPEWGLGKVLAVTPNLLKVHFKDYGKADVVKIAKANVTLEIASEQSDPVLDNLPPFLGDRFDVKPPWVTFDHGVEHFMREFPVGFKDPDYLARERD